MKIKALIAFVMFTGVLFGQTTTYTGTVKDLSGSVVTSGNVTFTLTPSVDTTISGTSRFTPNTVNCTINGSGALVANDGVSACVVTQNTALTPTGTSYTICIQPYFTSPGSCFVDYAVTSSKDISTVAPTPQLSPNYPITGVLFGTQNTWTAAQTGPFIDKGGDGYNIEAYTGADWCAKLNSANAALSAVPARLQVGYFSNVASCSADVSIGANHTVELIPNTYTLGTHSIVPAGANSGLYCFTGAAINYTGSGWEYDLNTQAEPHLEGCKFVLGATALGGARYRNTGNSFETKAYVRDLSIEASVRTAGQIGVLLQADNANSANYHNDIEVKTKFIDIGAEFKSLVNNQGPNGNRLKIDSTGHTIAVQHFDGTDNIIKGEILGANGGGNGIAFNFCAAGNGGYGSSNIALTSFSSEQGSTGGASKTINVASGAGLTVGCGNFNISGGQSNDSSPFTDANGATSTINIVTNTNVQFYTPVTVPVGSASTPSVRDIAATNSGLFFEPGGQPGISTLGTAHIIFDTTGPKLGSDAVVAWRSVTDPNGSPAAGLSYGGAAGQVNVGNGTAGDASGTINYSAVKLNGVTLASATAPTITSGFGTSPSLTANGTAAVMLNVGTGGTASSGTITMPFTAAHGWSCSVNNINASVGNRADNTVQISYTTTNVTVQNQTKSTGVGVAWTASDVVLLNCGAF